MKVCRPYPAITLIVFYALFSFAHALALEKLDENSIKAGYLYHFALLTEWQEFEFNNNFNMCVFGNTNIFKKLKSFSKKNIKGLNLNTKIINKASQINNCHLLFITGIRAIDFKEIEQELLGKTILTITDDPNLQSSSISIFLRPQGKQIVFEIDTKVASQSNITFSSRLLRLAR